MCFYLPTLALMVNLCLDLEQTGTAAQRWGARVALCLQMDYFHPYLYEAMDFLVLYLFSMRLLLYSQLMHSVR